MLFSLYLKKIIIILCILVSFYALHDSYYNIDTPIDRYGIKGVILTSSLLDFFPIFALLMNNPAHYYQIVSAVEPAISYDLRCTCQDLDMIANRLFSTDPFLANLINTTSYGPGIQAAIGSMTTHMAQGDFYGFQSAYIRLIGLRIACLDTMSIYMTIQELQTLGVAKETLVNCSREFICLHSPTVPSAHDLELLRGSNLMGEIEALMANNPFNR
jgi:hypothetical protein